MFWRVDEHLKEPMRGLERLEDRNQDERKIIITDLPFPPADSGIAKMVEEHEEEKEGIFKKEYESGKRSYARILKHSFVLILVLWLGYLFHRGITLEW